MPPCIQWIYIKLFVCILEYILQSVVIYPNTYKLYSCSDKWILNTLKYCLIVDIPLFIIMLHNYYIEQ